MIGNTDMLSDGEKAALADVVKNLLDRSEVAQIELIGSATYMTDHKDIDLAVYCGSAYAAEQLNLDLTTDGGKWKMCSENYDRMKEQNYWFSVRMGVFNLMVTWKREFFTDYILAMEVCKVLHLTSKEDRIAVCQVVRDRRPAADILAERAKKTVTADGEPNYRDWYIDAMKASNEAGFVGMTAAETIRAQAKQIRDFQHDIDFPDSEPFMDSGL